ncbi:MAG: c-type cytochrome domain-containing protein, partial [Verrucomicrobiales bacterium]
MVTFSRHRLLWRLRVTTTYIALLVSADAKISFETDIQPILSTHCYDCHGPEKQKSKLRLDSPLGILKGGESGEPVFVKGDSTNSHLIKLVTGEDPKEIMPPKGERLSEQQIGLLKTWIDEGAPLPEVDDSEVAKLETDHWSFQP